jgi:hypothetical protein
MESQFADSSLLVRRFDETVVSLLKPFFDSIGAVHTSSGHVFGLSGKAGDFGSDYTADYASVSGHFFIWMHRFELDNVALSVMYGDRELEITPLISIGGQTFALWEIGETLGLGDLDGLSQNMWIGDEAGVFRAISQLAAVVVAHWESLSTVGEVEMDETVRRRNARAAESQKEAKSKAMESASIRAATAFHQKQYGLVVKLFSPFETDSGLSQSATRMLDISRKHIGT